MTPNAYARTFGPTGWVTTPLWVVSYNTDLQMSISSAQVHRGIAHRPIRIQERYMQFDCVWNATKLSNGRRIPNEAAADFADRLRAHWLHALDTALPPPMEFNYVGLRRAFHGWIEGAKKGAQAHETTQRRSFRMRLVNAGNVIASSISDDSSPQPYLPTTQNARHYAGWYRYNSQYFQQNISPGPFSADSGLQGPMPATPGGVPPTSMGGTG